MKKKKYIIQYIKNLENNFVWIIHDTKKCIIIDPGSSNKIIKKLEKKKIVPILIFITHHHQDHIGGVKKILYRYPNIKIITSKKIFFYKETFFKNQILIKKKKKIFFNNNIIKIFFTPGHTKLDLSYYLPPFLFCGDLIFHGGSGNTKDGSIILLYKSFKKIYKFPKNTILLYSHEYSLQNLKFLNFFFKKNIFIQEYFFYLKKKNLKNKIITSSIEFEKKINIFFKILNFNNIKKNNFEILEKEIKECSNYYWDNLNKKKIFEIFEKFRILKNQF